LHRASACSSGALRSHHSRCFNHVHAQLRAQRECATAIVAPSASFRAWFFLTLRNRERYKHRSGAPLAAPPNAVAPPEQN
jgi:hypothetical protein